MRPCQVFGCGTVAEVRVGWVPAAAFRDDREGKAVDRLWFRGCVVHARAVWMNAKRNGQSPVYMIIERRPG